MPSTPRRRIGSRSTSVELLTDLFIEFFGGEVDYGYLVSRHERKQVASMDSQNFRGFALGYPVLAKQFHVQAAEELVPSQPTLGDVTSAEELERYQSWKREYKKAARGS